jgi:multiple sugar transport system ATP-binding protein
MRAEIAQLHRQMQSTFIYVTHDQAEAMTMSSRIAVMIEGRIVQIGAPADVYENPRDLRVAEFVGSPKINVLPGTVGSDSALAALGQMLGLTTPAPAGRCAIGVRPERIRLGDGSFAGDVVHIENLGAEAFIHIRHDGIPLPVVARIDHDRALPAIGSRIAFSFAPDAVRAFDAQGRRIDTKLQARREQILEVALG